jgi:hypothetical protein
VNFELRQGTPWVQKNVTKILNIWIFSWNYQCKSGPIRNENTKYSVPVVFWTFRIPPERRRRRYKFRVPSLHMWYRYNDRTQTGHFGSSFYAPEVHCIWKIHRSTGGLKNLESLRVDYRYVRHIFLHVALNRTFLVTLSLYRRHKMAQMLANVSFTWSYFRV